MLARARIGRRAGARERQLRQREDANGYRTKALREASECARALFFEGARMGPRKAVQALLRLPRLILYLCRLPRLEVPLSDEPAGLVIREHLALRRWGAPRFRLAQGVLWLPSDFASYLRGRHRQALRTNMRHAHARGVVCHRETLPAWRRSERGLRQRAPVERWWATDVDGVVVGEALLTVDRECALLHLLHTREPYVRWLMHAAIVERLCRSRQSLLITNSSDVPLLAPGQQHFQHLLGYLIVRLRPRSLQAGRPRMEDVPVPQLAAVAVFATVAIVGQQWLTTPVELAGQRALIWLTALITVRVAAGRAGWSTLVGAVAAMAIGALGAEPLISLAYFFCGVALDVELAAFPRLAHSIRSMPIVGATVMFGALIAPSFPTIGHHVAGTPWPIPPILGALAFGMIAALLGYSAGLRLRPKIASS